VTPAGPDHDAEPGLTPEASSGEVDAAFRRLGPGNRGGADPHALPGAPESRLAGRRRGRWAALRSRDQCLNGPRGRRQAGSDGWGRRPSA